MSPFSFMKPVWHRWSAIVMMLIAAVIALPGDAGRTFLERPAYGTVWAESGASGGERRRAILMIGDGLGAAQRLAGQLSKVGEGESLAMDTLPVTGWIQTANSDGGVTDSAAAATAMATGVRTKNGYLGVDPGGESLLSILELARTKGLATGLVTTSALSDATPAGFVAHIDDRTDWQAIAGQVLEAQVDVLMGGGEQDWLPSPLSTCNPGGAGRRTDARNLVGEAQADGYEFICTKSAFDGLGPGYHFLLGFFGYDLLLRPYTPSLAEMTTMALDILATDPDGFFLVVEGSQIDKAAHAQDGADMVDDVVTFDDAVQVAYAFTLANPDTLLIVVADHETGGVVVEVADTCDSPNEGPFPIFGGGTFCTDFTTSGHTGVDIPLSALGPGSGFQAGTWPNTTIHTTILRHLTGYHSNHLPLLFSP